jgi:hypothetical protein
MEQEASVPPPDVIESVFHNPATANVFHHAVLYISGISVPVVVPSGHSGVSVLDSRLDFKIKRHCPDCSYYRHIHPRVLQQVRL